MSPARRLAVMERLATVDPRAAVAFRDSEPASASAIKVATDARERDRQATDARRGDLDGQAWRAEQRAKQLRMLLHSESVNVMGLQKQVDAEGIAYFKTDARRALDAAKDRLDALAAEVKQLEDSARTWRAQSSALLAGGRERAQEHSRSPAAPDGGGVEGNTARRRDVVSRAPVSPAAPAPARVEWDVQVPVGQARGPISPAVPVCIVCGGPLAIAVEWWPFGRGVKSWSIACRTDPRHPQ